jgi:hypothetical protein
MRYTAIQALTRRELLTLAGGAMSAGLLAACSPAAPSQPSAGSSAATSAPATTGAPPSGAARPTADPGQARSGGELIFTVNDAGATPTGQAWQQARPASDRSPLGTCVTLGEETGWPPRCCDPRREAALSEEFAD